MTTNEAQPASEVSRTFAGFLSELEDVATRLTVRQAELASELAAVEAELSRIETARATLADKRPRNRPGSDRRRNQTASDRVRRIAAYAREQGGVFTARGAADALGITTHSVGPVLAGMVKRGEATVREDGDGRRYTLA